jgi:hypothetical protein
MWSRACRDDGAGVRGKTTTQGCARRCARRVWNEWSLSAICQHANPAMPCAAGCRLDPSVPMSWDDVVRSMVLESSVWGPHSLHTAEATGSKPVTPTSTNSLLDLALRGACQKIRQKTTLSRRQNAFRAIRFERLALPLAPCLASQIGRCCHLQRRVTVQVEAASWLPVAVRSEPFRTAVNGTLVARPARMTLAYRGAAGGLGEHPIAARRGEGVDLELWLLVGGGDAGVAEQAPHAPERPTTP